MKKISFLLMAFGLMAASCTTSEFENVYGEDPHADFAKQFTQTFGQIAPNHDWGFGTAMRTVVKPDMPAYPTENLPADVTDDEAKYVQEWFENNPGLSEEGLDISNFYIQYVSSKPGLKQGLWHHYDQNRVNNGYDSNYWDEEFTDNAGMDYLVISDGKDYEEHVLDFNNYNSGSFGIVYIENGSALQWGYHSSWGDGGYAPNKDGIYYFFKLAEIDVPGVGKGWYIGLSVYGKKYDNGDKEIGIQRLDYAEDWIFKLTPAEPISEPEGTLRIIAEDLGTATSDFDYNDVVFDAYIDDEGYAHITLQAAGGTLPLYVAGEEVHEQFKVNTNVMVNTNAVGGVNKPAVSYISKDTYKSVKEIPVVVYKDGTELILKAEAGKAAEKIAVGTDYQWTNEREAVYDKYSKFYDYVGDATTEWYK